MKECAAEPHPPPGIDRATLSHIAIYMRTIGQCTPWGLFLTKLWLKQPYSHEQEDIRPDQKSNIIVLCPPRSRPVLAPRETADTLLGYTQYLASVDKCVQQSNLYTGLDEIESVRRHNLSELVDRSVQCLVNTDKQQHKNLIDKQTIKEGPILSDVAPACFKPGHYEVISRSTNCICLVAD